MSDEYADAMGIALRRLATSDRFESEVRQALTKFSAPVADRVVARLRENGMLNDARTTSSIVERNNGRRAIGADLLRERLQRRGAPEEKLRDAIDEAAGDEPDRAAALIVAKYPNRTAKERPRAARFLASRGFSEESIDSALTATFGEPTDLYASDVFTE